MRAFFKSIFKDLLLFGAAGALVSFFVATWYVDRALAASATNLKERVTALALSGASVVNPTQHATLNDERFLAYELQWKALRQLAFAQYGSGGQQGVEILSLRKDEKGDFVSVFAAENQRFKKVLRLSPVAKLCSETGRRQVSQEIGDVVEAAAPLADELNRPTGIVLARMEAGSYKTLQTTLARARMLAVVGGFLALSLLGLLVRPRHSADISLLEEELEHLAQTDGLHGRIEASASGFTQGVADKFNAILDRVQQMVSSVKKGADLVSGSSQRVSLTATEVSRMANEVATTIQQVAKGTEDQSSRTSELHTIIQAVSESSISNRRKAEETSAASEGASEIAETIHDLAQDAVSQMEKLSRDIRSTAEAIYTLGDKSEKIGEVVDIIRSIADQTNLLALNAAIEAARAGDAGRGFAVVADEVRKLAEGSATSADQIAAMISEIQGSTKDAVASMQRGSEGVSEGSEVISRVGSGLTQIIEAVRRTSQLAADISSSAREQTARSSAGAQRIEEINAIAEQTAASTEQVAASTEEATASMQELTATSAQLAEMARELQGLVSRFDSRN